MTEPLRPAVFDDTERYLRVWFSSDGGTFEQLTPDTQVAAVPYALQAEEAANADTVDGLHAGQLGADYENVIVVAKSGGDYTTVQAAIDSISDAAVDNAYLVWVAPGVYSETVTLMPYVHLQGAGQEATVITSTASSGSFPPAQATLEMAGDTSLRDLTVGNTGAGTYNVALVARTGTTRTLVADVTAQAQGGGTFNFGILLTGSDTGVTLQDVTALGENGSDTNYGLRNFGAETTVRGGSFIARGGTSAEGINNASGARLEVEGVIARGADGSDDNCGLYNSSVATLRGGSFTGRGGTSAQGISNSSGDTLEAEGVTALGEGGSNENYGMLNYGAAMVRGGSFTAHGGTSARGIHNSTAATLRAERVTALGENGSNSYGLFGYGTVTVRNSSFTGRGGTHTRGIYNSGGSTSLGAENVIALGENGSDTNYGLYNYNGAKATARSGSFTGRGGTDTRGIYNHGNGTILETENVTALAENGSSTNYGLENDEEATLYGGSCIGYGGSYTRGIYNTDSGTTLEAEGVTALGEDGSTENYGLYNAYGAATLRGGSFIARGGADTYGIYNYDGAADLKADRITALGENGSTNYGLYNYEATATADSSQFTGDVSGVYQFGGTVYLGASQLDGSAAVGGGGTLTCVHVYDGNYSDYNCP
jgi:hypothetical protein